MASYSSFEVNRVKNSGTVGRREPGKEIKIRTVPHYWRKLRSDLIPLISKYLLVAEYRSVILYIIIFPSRIR